MDIQLWQLGALIALLAKYYPDVNLDEHVRKGVQIAKQLNLEEDLGRKGQGEYSFVTGQRTVDSAGTPVQLSITSIPIKAGTKLTMIAKPGNAGTIYFANSEANCITGRYFDGLSAGLAHSISALDAQDIWLDASDSGDGVSFYVEF
jgi:hypothetical protein